MDSIKKVATFAVKAPREGYFVCGLSNGIMIISSFGKRICKRGKCCRGRNKFGVGLIEKNEDPDRSPRSEVTVERQNAHLGANCTGLNAPS